MSTNENMDLNDYYDGRTDGLMGRTAARTTDAYMMGFNDGEVQAERDADAEFDDWGYGQEYEWDAVSQGMYDDDPSPYSGTY